MPSDENFVKRLEEAAQRALAPKIDSVAEELKNRISEYLDQFKKRLEETEESSFATEVQAILKEAVLSASTESARDKEELLAFLTHFAHDVRSKETQEELLNLLLDGAHRFAPRVALFVTRGDQFHGWSSRGYSEDVAQGIADWRCSQDDTPLLKNALTVDGLTSINQILEEVDLRELFGDEAPLPWHAFPMRAIQRPVAVLLASPLEKQTCDLESLCILMDLTGLCIENIALKILQEMRGAVSPIDQAPEKTPEEWVPPVAEIDAEADVEEEEDDQTGDEIKAEPAEEGQPAVGTIAEVETEAAEDSYGVETIEAATPEMEEETVEADLEEQTEPMLDDEVEGKAEVPAVEEVSSKPEVDETAEELEEEADQEREEESEEEVLSKGEQEIPEDLREEAVMEPGVEEVSLETESEEASEIVVESQPAEAAEHVTDESAPGSEEASEIVVESQPAETAEHLTDGSAPESPVESPPEEPEAQDHPESASSLDDGLEKTDVAIDEDRQVETTQDESSFHTPDEMREIVASEAEVPKAAILKKVEHPSEEEKMHSDAKRFARLLVSEIKLYNEQGVMEGRANQDLYVRLKRDVDRSRDMYEKRVSPIVAHKADYFHDEIIRILADNDPSSLGSEYPGPLVHN